MLLIIAGIYAFLWGKTKETNREAKLVTKSTSRQGISNMQTAPDPETKSQDTIVKESPV